MRYSIIALLAVLLPYRAWSLSIQPADWGQFSYQDEVMCTTSIRADTPVGVVQKHGKYGLADSAGKILIPLHYENGTCLSNGRATFLTQDKWGVLDSQHHVLVPFIFDKPISDFNGTDKVIITHKRDDDVYSAMYGADGQILLDYQHGRLRFEGDRLIRFEGNHGQSGFMDSTGQVILTGHYDWVKLLDDKAGDERFLVSINHKILMIDRHKTILAQGYDNISPFDEQGIARVYQSLHHRDKVGFMDKNGKLIVRPKLHDYPMWHDVFGYEWQLRTDGTSCTLFLEDFHGTPVNDPNFPNKPCKLLTTPNQTPAPIEHGFWRRIWDKYLE